MRSAVLKKSASKPARAVAARMPAASVAAPAPAVAVAARGRVQPAGLVDRVYRELLSDITQGAMGEGDRLPTEQSLTERFSASRPTIREALSRLRSDGIIASRQGSGTYVTRRPDPDIPRFAPLESISDLQRLFDFRIAVESGAAAIAAHAADEAALTVIEASFARLSTVVVEQALGADEDFEFHLAIARASKNQFFVSALGSMQAQLLLSMSLMRNLSLIKSRERQRMVQDEHEAIVQALRAHDADAAGAAMRAHLQRACSRMFGN